MGKRKRAGGRRLMFCFYLHNSIMRDNIEEFKKEIRRLLEGCGPGLAHDNLFIPHLLSLIIQARSVGCAEALVKGDAGISLDLNISSAQLNNYPLHCAAKALAPGIVRLFLKHGANKNVQCKDGVLPFDSALASVRAWALWTPADSVYMLLFTLCGKRMLDPLMTIQAFINHLSIAEFLDAVIRYGFEGKTIELAALLLSASDNMNGYFPSDGYTHLKLVREFVLHQIVSLANEECQLLDTSPSKLADCRHKKQVMMSTMLLVEIFCRKDAHAKSFVPVSPNKLFTVEEVVKMLVALGFELTGEDAFVAEGMIGPGKLQHLSNENLSSRSSEVSTADVARDSFQPENEKLLSLHNELQKMSSNEMLSKWTPEESIFKLIVMLCLPEMTPLLENIRLLVNYVEMIHELACYLALENKLIELSVVLMVAREKLMDRMMIQQEDNRKRHINFRQAINMEFGKLVDLEYRLMGVKTEKEKILHESCERRISSIMRSLPLLEIFEKAGSAIEGYLKNRNDVLKEEVEENVLRLLEDSGFECGLEETQRNKIDGSSVDVDRINEAMKVIGMNRRPQHRISLLSICKPFASIHNQIRTFSSGRRVLEPPVVSSSSQSFCTFGTLNARLHSGYYHKPPVPKEKELAIVVEQQIQSFQGRKQLASVALALRRVWRYF